MTETKKNIVQRVVAALVALGLDATYEYPGHVEIQRPDDTIFVTGDANETWTVDHRTANGQEDVGGSFDTGIPVVHDEPAFAEEYRDKQAANVAAKIKACLDVAYPVLTTNYLLGLMNRVVSVMKEQKDENNETIAEANSELYRELVAVQKLAEDAIGVSHAGCAADVILLAMGDVHAAECVCKECKDQDETATKAGLELGRDYTGEYDALRPMTTCAICQHSKGAGLIVCWACYRQYDGRNNFPARDIKLLLQSAALAAKPADGAVQ